MAGLAFLTYHKKKLPVKLGIFTMMLVQEEYGISFAQGEIGDEANIKPSQYIPLLFHGLEQGHRIAKRSFTFEMDDMHDILNDCFMEFVAILPKFFPDSEDMLELEKVMGEVGKEKEVKPVESITTK